MGSEDRRVPGPLASHDRFPSRPGSARALRLGLPASQFRRGDWRDRSGSESRLVEYYCGSWVGFDPTNGNDIGLSHVVVAKGRDYGDVPPLKGIYHGAPSRALGVTVEITRLS